MDIENNPIEIASMELHDVDDLYKCNKTVLPVYYTRQQHREFIENRDYLLLKAIDNQKKKSFAGYIIGRLENSKRFHIVSIGVYAKYRRQKIGSLLTSDIENKIRTKFSDVLFLSLNVQTTNSIAIEFYESRGFKKVRTLDNYYGANDHAYTYGKKIS